PTDEVDVSCWRTTCRGLRGERVNQGKGNEEDKQNDDSHTNLTFRISNCRKRGFVKNPPGHPREPGLRLVGRIDGDKLPTSPIVDPPAFLQCLGMRRRKMKPGKGFVAGMRLLLW